LSAGHDFTAHIKAIEQFSSMGGMLPEQVWDYSDIPSKGMYLGRPAGSAQPLVWAHAEYLKLLRSAVDGKVFDRISVVEARYAVPKEKRTFTNHIEIFEVTRPISIIFSGYTLRIVDREHFHIVYTFDNWATTQSMEAHSVGYPGSFADIPTAPEQTGKIIFTLAWTTQDGKERWLGKNIEVSVVTLPASTNV
jgi:glucoamylase